MGIDRFSPSMAGVPEAEDLEKKMVSSNVISGADIKKYADFIIHHLEGLKNKSEQETTSFVVDALSDDNILKSSEVEDKIMSGELDKNEAQSAIRRVRQALMEQLKAAKIDEKIYLVIKKIVEKGISSEKKTQNMEAITGITTKKEGLVKRKLKKPPANKEPAKPKEGRRNIINAVVQIGGAGEEGIFKDQESFLEAHQEDSEAAFVLLDKLDSHPNIVNIKERDPVSRRIIYEKLNLQTLNKYLSSGEKNKEKFIIGLKVIKDCVEGAKYLAENGLILQDIKLDNLGLVKQEEDIKGALFDLEGLFKIGTKMGSRVSGGLKYLPPEIFQPEGDLIRPGEMVYQFGICLKDILIMYEEWRGLKILDQNIIKKLNVLIKKMTEKKSEERIGLPEAKTELDILLRSL